MRSRRRLIEACNGIAAGMSLAGCDRGRISATAMRQTLPRDKIEFAMECWSPMIGLSAIKFRPAAPDIIM